MARITTEMFMEKLNKVDERLDRMEAKLDGIETKLDAMINSSAVKNPVKSGAGKANKVNTTKTEGKVVNATKNTVKIEVVEGTGKGAGKQFIKLIFSGKPSDKVRNDMKSHGFHFFSNDSTWSAYNNDKNMAFAKALIK